jgi:hypothetical protein
VLSCIESCGAIFGASAFSGSLPAFAGGAEFTRGRAGPLRRGISIVAKGGHAICKSGAAPSETSLADVERACNVGFTCTAFAHGMLGFFLMLHPFDSNATAMKNNAVLQSRGKFRVKA